MIVTQLFDRHKSLLADAVRAVETREFWTPFPEIPSGKIYGETAKAEGQATFNALLGQPFDLPSHPESARVGGEVSPWGLCLAITYPTADAQTLTAASQAVAAQWAAAPVQARIGVCLEILTRLNRISFTMANAVTHTTGQGFAMAFQAGGPHAQDRGLEAIAVAYTEMMRAPHHAIWEKPQGKAVPLRLEKHWQIMPRGVGLVIGCNTFPTWNSYPGLFASLATGNPVIVKPHPAAILPLALTVQIAREVLVEAGFAANTVLLAADALGATALATDPAVRIIDYTGSTQFGDWLRAHTSRDVQLYTEEAGVNSIAINATDDFAGMAANIAFSLALYSGQMCTSPQSIFIPKHGIATDQGHKSLAEVAASIVAAIDALLADPAQAVGICGAIANPATLARIQAARDLGTVLRDTTPLPQGRCATPLIVAVDASSDAYRQECFGPVSFVVAVADAQAGIETATQIAATKGAITAALYDTDPARIAQAAQAFATAGVNLSVNLTGNIFVNQSAAFSDYHVTGANPAGNACLTDSAFIVGRFRLAMWRQPKAAPPPDEIL